MPKVVISNTSPIFYLHRLGYLELLERLYGEILIPYAVLEELKEGERTGEDVPDIGEYKWIKLRNVAVPSSIKTIPDLGKGEAEVMALGLEEKEHLLIIDDSLARKIAKLQSLKFTGTAGILVKAKEKGLINEVKPILDLLKDKRFFLRETVIADILKLSGEV